MKKKLTLIIVALSLIVSFGFTNVYADWNPGDPNDWYFKFKATDASTTVWELTFHAVDDTYLSGHGLEAAFDPASGYLSGVSDDDFYAHGFDELPGGIMNEPDGMISNIGGSILGGYDFNPGESMVIAQVTYNSAAELDWNWINNDFFAIGINEQMWTASNLLATNDGITAPAVLLDTSTEIHFGQTVPVPAAIWLLGSGMLGLFGINKRKKK